MEQALRGVPEVNREAPEGLTLVKTGREDRPEGDLVYKESQPAASSATQPAATSASLVSPPTTSATSINVSGTLLRPGMPSMRMAPAEATSGAGKAAR